MSADHIRDTILRAWARLNRRPAGQPPQTRRQLEPPRPGRPRDAGTPVPAPEAEALGKPGFAEEALPWLDAVHRFALRLTRDGTAAEDLVQETYLRAFRSWDQFERGTNCRSWLFTICRNTHLHERERASARYEVAESDVSDTGNGSAGMIDQRALATTAPDDFFAALVDDDLIRAIDALPEDFRETLILSDLADLNYAEIAEVLDVPVGTVKSRLSRARRQTREALLVQGMDSAYRDDQAATQRGAR